MEIVMNFIIAPDDAGRMLRSSTQLSMLGNPRAKTRAKRGHGQHIHESPWAPAADEVESSLADGLESPAPSFVAVVQDLSVPQRS